MNNTHLFRKKAKIGLADAIERAKLAQDNGIITQSFYNMLVRQVDEKDVYPLTMALVENGLMVRTGSVKNFESLRRDIYGSPKSVKNLSVKEKLPKSSQAVLYNDEDESDDYWGKEEEEVKETPEEPNDEILEMRDVLEGAGMAINKDGMVSFYRSNIPGIYKDKLPQAMPLEAVANLWERRLEITDNERSRIQSIQNVLSKLRSQVDERAKTNKTPKISDIETALRELENYGFDPRSRSEMTRNISGNIESVFDAVMDNNWIKAGSAISEAQELLDVYVENQVENYEKNLYIWDALDKLSGLRKSDPKSFQTAIGGLGGVSARLYAAFRMQYLEEAV